MCYSGRKYPSLRITVCTADKEILDHFARVFGGNVIERNQSAPHKRKLFSWNQSGLQAQDTLRQLLPWLISKRIPAELALQPTFKGYTGKPLSETEYALRACISAQISAYNQRIDA